MPNLFTSATSHSFSDHLIETGRSKNTAKSYVADMREFELWLKANPEPDETRMVNRWLAASAKKLSPSSVRRRKTSAQAYLRFMKINTEITYRIPQAPPPNPRPLPDGMLGVDRLANAAGPDKLMILLCGKMGLRISEALSLTWDDCDLDAQTVLVLGKGSKFRKLPMAESVRDTLEHTYRSPHRNTVTQGRTDSSARKLIKNLAKTLYRDADVSSHDLRATFATDMYNRTKDIAVVQEWLGHSSPETTRRYVGVSLDAMRSAL